VLWHALSRCTPNAVWVRVLLVHVHVMCVSFAEVVGVWKCDLTQAVVRPDPQPAALENDDGHNDDDTGSGGDETNEEDSEDDDEECVPSPRKTGASGKDAIVARTQRSSWTCPLAWRSCASGARCFGMSSAAVA
jgi:hypothetical protein